MKTFLILSLSLILVFSVVLAQKPKRARQTRPAPAPTPPPKPPTINWGKCPQLEPKDADKVQKATILEDCLKTHPIPKNLTETIIENHQRDIAKCALNKENWFEKNGSYKFAKAEQEIKKKGLTKAVETSLIKEHKKCETESKSKFPQKAKIIDQVQFYQACMDFHITEKCEIKLE